MIKQSLERIPRAVVAPIADGLAYEQVEEGIVSCRDRAPKIGLRGFVSANESVGMFQQFNVVGHACSRPLRVARSLLSAAAEVEIGDQAPVFVRMNFVG